MKTQQVIRACSGLFVIGIIVWFVVGDGALPPTVAGEGPSKPAAAPPKKAEERTLAQFAASKNASAVVRITATATRAGNVPTPPVATKMTQEVILQSPHLHAVRAVAFHPKGRLLLSVGNDSQLKIWDLRTGRLFATLPGATAPLYAVTYSPDGRWIVAGGADRYVHIWDAQTLEHVDQLEGHSYWIVDLAFSQDGAFLASASKDKFVIVWDFAKRLPSQTLEHSSQVFGVALSRDGKLAATVDEESLHVWNVGDGSERHQTPHNGGSDRVSFSADDKFVYAGVFRSRYADKKAEEKEDEREIVETIRETLRIDLAKDRVQRFPNRFVDLSLTDGSLVALEGVGRIHFRDPTTGESKRSWVAPTAPSQAEVLKARTNWSILSSDFPRWHAPDETSRLSPDGRLIASSDIEGRIGIWDAATGREVRTLGIRADVPYGLGGGNQMRPLLVAWSPKDPILAMGSLDGRVRFLDLRGNLAPTVIDAHRGTVNAIAFSGDGRTLATAGNDDKILLWDVQARRLRRTLDCSAVAGTPKSLAFSPDGKRLACGHNFSAHGDGCTTLWSPQTGKQIALLRDDGPTGGSDRFIAAGTAINGVAFINDGASLLVTRGIVCRLSRFEMEKYEQTHSVAIGDEQIHGLAASRDGKLFALAYGRLKQIDQITETPATNNVLVFGTDPPLPGLAGHRLTPMCVDFSPDGKKIASGASDGRVMIASLDERRKPVFYRAHDVDVDSVSFSHDGRFVVSAGRDMSLRIWDVDANKPAATIVAFNDTDYAVVTPDGHYASSRDALSAVALRTADGSMPMDLFDAILNRPDKVLETFGYAPRETLDLYTAACERRERRLGLHAATAKTNMRAPSIAFAGGDAQASTSERSVDVKLKAKSAEGKLAGLKVYVNDVPVGLADGHNLKSHNTAALDAEVNIPLSAGANKIQISVSDDRGIESLPITFETTCLASPAPRLFVAALGVSDNNDPGLKLQFPAKDARDVAAAFAKSLAACDTAKTFVRTDKEVTRETLAEVRKFFDESTVDDVAILFVAGHGLLDARMDYWFATHDIQRRKPGERGIAFAELEALLDGIAARRRLLLIDTCHAGESEVESDATIDASKSEEIADLLQTMFVDLRRDTGTTIIVASTAEGRAFEDKKTLKNGYFTGALLQGLMQGKADKNGDEQVKVSELRDYILAQVPKMTGEMKGEIQKPRVRRENPEYDFRLK